MVTAKRTMKQIKAEWTGPPCPPTPTQQMINEFTTSLQKREDNIIESFLRDNAMPPIKGNITQGKLKWRGIKLHQNRHGIGRPIERQLFQRGKPISPLIIIIFSQLYNFNNGNG